MLAPARKVYFESTRIGDELPAMAKAPIDRVQLARYAGATGDFNPLWVDDAFAKAAGMPSVMAPPGLAMGFLGQLVSDWGKGAQIKKLNARFSRMLWPGDTLVCKGRVFDRYGQNGHYYIELELWAENQRGELVAKAHGTLKAFYSPDDELRARNGQPPIVVNVARSSLLVATMPATAKKATKPPPKVAAKVSAKPAAPQKAAPKKVAPKAVKPKPKLMPAKKVKPKRR